MLSSLAWKLTARVLALPPIRRALIAYAVKHPYTHIGPEGDEYMMRYWVFNAYNRDYEGQRFPRLPSIRVHHIKRPDSDEHLHDHPLRSRVILLSGYYWEKSVLRWLGHSIPMRSRALRGGSTYYLDPRNKYHAIYALGDAGGVWSVFITWPKRGGGDEGSWGFLVDGVHVDQATYKLMMGGRLSKLRGEASGSQS